MYPGKDEKWYGNTLTEIIPPKVINYPLSAETSREICFWDFSAITFGVLIIVEIPDSSYM